jgi:hypothetical protein
MKYDRNRSITFNLANGLANTKDHFNYFGVSKIVKTKLHVLNGFTCAHDVLLGNDGDTVCVVSIRQHKSDLPVVRNGKITYPGERRVTDIMVSSHSLKELGRTFDEVVESGLDANWVPANALYFNSEDIGNAKAEATMYIKECFYAV